MTRYLLALAAELTRRNPAFEPIARHLHSALRLSHHNGSRPRPVPGTETPDDDYSQHPTPDLIRELRDALNAEQTCAVGRNPETHALATHLMEQVERVKS